MAGDPPVILFHGTSDQIVNPEQSQELYDSLKKHNAVTELVSVFGGTHGGSEMYTSENLNKATAFLDKAREAKAAAVEAPPDTGRTSIETPLYQSKRPAGIDFRPKTFGTFDVKGRSIPTEHSNYRPTLKRLIIP